MARDRQKNALGWLWPWWLWRAGKESGELEEETAEHGRAGQGWAAHLRPKGHCLVGGWGRPPPGTGALETGHILGGQEGGAAGSCPTPAEGGALSGA